MENMSLDQYIRNNSSTQSGSRARKFSTDSPRSFQRRINVRSTIKNGSSPVKFTARLDNISDTRSMNGSNTRPSLRRIPVNSQSTYHTTTTTTTTTSAPPPLKITIQNTTAKKEIRDRPVVPSRLDNNNLPKIRITKTVDRNSSVSRPIRHNSNGIDSRISDNRINRYSTRSVGGGGGGGDDDVDVDDDYNNNDNDNIRLNLKSNDRRSSYSSDHSNGTGPSLFERRNSNGGYNGPTGKSLQLFTGSRLNISNLHPAINENDLKVLFESVGDIKQIKIHYDQSGRNDGTAYVILTRHSDAMAALKKYNGAQLDGRTLIITTGPSLQEDVRKSF
ncbi:hypothetical protein RB653_000727 [Dictyostelium firmibasis]|uniref:RRM domain-containing protein n=1 Tax=Dictyostelium firmibasis TaxID=79012 RepID=A0AAN7U353_9MYCE